MNQTHENKIIHLATDHAGFTLKEQIKAWLESQGHSVVDHGAQVIDEQDDFPDFVAPAAQAVADDLANSVAIVLGGSGQGEAMTANRYKGVRAVIYYGGDVEIVKLSRTHNDANVLALGARFVDNDNINDVIATWLATPFAGEEKRVRRNQKIDQV